ncbi:MAG: LamG domain-containing protein [Verrucomicrobiota bacterium]
MSTFQIAALLARYAAVFFIAMCLPVQLHAAPATHYTNQEGFGYYDIWWRESRSDRKTALLLHCGAPREHPWQKHGDAKVAKQQSPQEEQLVTELDGMLGGDPDAGGGMGDMGGDIEQQQKRQFASREGRSRAEAAPPGTVFDYSPNLGSAELPETVHKVEEGRFGKGLKFTGNQPLSIFVGSNGGHRTMDVWIKPAALPQDAAWLVGTRGGARLHLLSDGRVRLTWPHVRGLPGAITLTSKTAIPAGEWSHVAAYLWFSGGHARKYQLRLGINGRAITQRAKENFPPLVPPETMYFIGANPDGKEAFTGIMDEIRVASRRRYNTREDWPDFDPANHPRPVPFGPPLFEKDRRVFHVGFESRSLTVHPEGEPTLRWDLEDHAEFADLQVDSPFGKGLLVDPALGFPRFSIRGMSPHQGTLEMWVQPVNWDNNSAFGERISWNRKTLSVVRFRGRDNRNGKIVTFMEVALPRASMFGGKGWLQPGTWTHLAWSWSREDVLKEAGWGKTRKGDPVSTFRAIRFGEQIWRAMLKRDPGLLDHVEPLYAEIGVSNDLTVYHDQRPAILVDEIIYHSRHVNREKLKKPTADWHRKYHPEAQ